MTLSWQNQMLSMLEVAKSQLENSMRQLVSARVYGDIEGQKECSLEFEEALQNMDYARSLIEIIVKHYKEKKE